MFFLTLLRLGGGGGANMPPGGGGSRTAPIEDPDFICVSINGQLGAVKGR